MKVKNSGARKSCQRMSSLRYAQGKSEGAERPKNLDLETLRPMQWASA